MNRSHRYLLLLALALASTSTPAFAVVKNWVGTSADWNLGANWTPTGVPGPADDAVFPGGSYTITYTPFNGWTETAQTLAFTGAGNVSFGFIGPTPGYINVINSISQNGTGSVAIQPDILCGNAPGDPFTLDGTGPGPVRMWSAFLGVPNLTVNGGNYGIGTGGSIGGITLDRITVNAGTLEIGISNAVVVNNPVVVNGGTLRLCTVVSIFGATFTAPSVTVNAGGGFFANAPINSSITMNVGSILSPGCSPGTMAVSGNVTLAPGSSSNFELAAPAGPNDRIDVTGDLNLGGTLNVAGLPGFGVGVYRLFDYTGILSGPGLTLGSMPSGFSYAINTATLGQVDLVVTPAAPVGPICLIDTNMTWRYLDNGSDQGTTWKAPAFNDSGWSNGLPLFGVDTFAYPWPFRTPMPIGTNRITYYFRKHFSLSGSPAGVVLTVSGYHDDGAVYYLNGVEAARVRIAAGPVLHNTLAINLAPEGVLDTFTLSSASLQTGDNVLAVEVHQTSLNSSDIVFGMTLKAEVPAPTVTVVAKPGWNLIANPLNGTNNLLNTILPNVPLESQVMLWNPVLQDFDTVSIHDGTAWLDNSTGNPSTTSVNPGEGFFFFNSSPADITLNFRGQLAFARPPIPATILRGGYVLLSRGDLGPGTFDNVVGLPPEPGCQFLTFNATTQNYSTNSFSGGSWSLGAPALAIAESAFVYYPAPGTPYIIQQPVSLTVNQGQPATFSVVAAGGNLHYRWSRNFNPMVAATNAELHIADVEGGDEGIYRCTVSNSVGAVTSEPATLSMIADLTPPSLLSASVDCMSNKVTLTFSEKMNATSAGNSANYTISGGVTILAIIVSPDGKTVCLFTTALSAGASYVVTMNNLADAAGNPLPPNTARDFACPSAPVITDPSQPANQAVELNHLATFNVVAAGNGPLLYQWLHGGFPILGATRTVYSVNAVGFADAGDYACVVSNAYGSVTSRVATLTVLQDNTAPTLVRVRADCASNKVTVVFSERMDAGTAAEPSNYFISDGVNVLSAMLGADGRSVCLFVDALTSGMTYTLDVYSATDLAGNSLSPDPSQRDFSCYTGPVITSVWPLTAQMGDIITIEGTGFDPVRANNSVARIAINEQGIKVYENPFEVIEASSNQLQVLVGPVPPGFRQGPLGVAVGTGVEAATIVGEVTTGNNLRLVKVPWLGQVGEPGPEGVLGSLSLRPEDATGLWGGPLGTPPGLAWEPLPPLWTFTTTSEPALSSQEITLIPTPAPPTGTTWVFNEPVANGGISFVISNECPALTKVQIQCNWTVTGSNGLSMDIIIPNLILHARLPAAACAQAICDVIAGAYAQAGVQILCTVTNAGTNAARLTITVPGGSISDGAGVICFSPAEAGRSAPFISSIICPEDGQHDDWITITGGNFGNNPDDLCVQLMNGSSTVPLLVLYAQDDRILAQFGLVPSNAVPGRIGLVRGIGGPRSIVDPADGQHDDIIVSPQPAWVFASTQAGVMSADIITPIPTPPPAVPGLGQPMKKRFYSEAVNSNGVMCLVVDTNCPPGTKITIRAHFGLVDFNTNDNVKCPLQHIDTLLENSEMQSTTFTNGNCVEFICRFLEQAFYNSQNTQFGGCFGYPIVCSADLQTGKITLTANPDCGCKLVGGSVSVELCIPPPGGTAAPVITSISTNILHTGAIINIIGSGFGQNPDNVCAVVVNTNRLIPLRVLDATDTLLTLEVGPIPPDAEPGRIGLAIGHGSVGMFQPALPGLAPQPAWFFTSTNGGVMSPFTVTPVHVPPVSQVWYHSFLSNGQIYVFLPGPCPPGTKLTMDGHFDIQSTNSPIRHADCWLPVVNYQQGGSAIECARRICDSFVCGFLQRTGVRLNCNVIPVGNGALVCLGYPGGTIVNGGMTVCVSICNEPPVAPCVSNIVASFGHGGPGDNFAGAQGASIRPEMLAWLASGGITSTRGYDDSGLVNRSFADSFSNLPDCITKATLRIRLRANRDIERNDTIMLAFAGTGGVLDPNRWSSYIGAGNAGPGVLNYTWLATNVAELVLDLGRLPLGNNQYKDLIPTLCAKRYLDLYVQDDTSVDYAILSIESCRCRQDIVLCAPPGQPCAPVTYATPTFTDLCCPNIPGSLRVTCTPASGTCFPVGTNTVHCTAIDAAGRRARCCFRVIVLQGNPPVFSSCPTNITTNVCSSSMALIYPMPVVTGGTLLGCTPSSGSTFNSGTTMVACTASNVCGTATCSFTVTVIADTTPPVITGPCVTNLFEASVAAPSTGVVRRLSAAGINCMKGLTNCAQDCFFAHTFANLPSSITSAKLTVRLKPCGGAGWTDTLGLYFINAAGASLPGGWSRLIGSGGGGGSDLLPNDWDTYTSGHTFTFDLGNMPLGGANLLPYMNQHGFVDFIVQDDTAVESLTLEVVSCGCGDTRLVECGTPWTFGIPTAFDARCGTNVTLTSVVVGSGNACSNVNTIVWTATDCCGNSTTCTQRVVVVDTTPPVVGSGAGGGGAVLDESFDPGSISFASGVAPNAAISQIFKVGSSGTLVQLDLWIARASINSTHDLLIELRDVLVTGEPDLGGPARASVTASWATIPTGYNWMSFTFAPGAAVTAGETLAIVLRDPVVSADANTTYGLAGAYFPFATYPDGDAYYTYLPTVSWTPYGVGSYDYAFRTYLASSGGCATNKTVECGSPWTFDAPAVFDACCGTNVTPTYTTVTNGNCPQSITRSWRATDCCGNSADCTQTVTVMDTTPPVLRCPEAIKITTCSNSVPVYYRVLATDNCDANVLVNCTPPSGSPFNSGTTLVHCTAVDDCGNTNSCLFPVVISTTPTWQLFAAGARDCYASPNELAARSACLTTAYPGALWKNFDDPTVNRFFGHSWTLPNVTYFDGYLVTRMKDFNCSGISQNDTISLGLLNCSPATWGWSRHLGPDGADPGLQPASWCGISNCNHLFNLHLSALPAFPSGTTTVLPLINSTSPRRFDMFVQDDTRVDFANLWLRRCPPQHIIGGLEATLTNAVIAYGSNSWSLIADPQLASPVSYGASLSLGYTDGAALTLGTAALTQSSNGAVSVQLRSFMPNGGTHSLGFLGTNGVDGQFFVTPTASSAPGGSTLTLRNHGVTVLTQTYGPGVLPANCSLIANQLVAPSFTFQGGTNATMRLPSTTAVSGAFGTFQADEIAISVADSSTWIRGFCPYAVDVTATGVAEVSLSQIQIGATGIIDPADGQHDDWFATVSGDALARVENGQLTLSALDAAGSSTMFFDVQLDTSVAGGGTNEFRATIQTSFGQFSPVPNNASLRFRPAFEDAIVDPADGQHDDWVAISCHISTNGQDWDISATLSNAPLAFTSVEVLNNGSNVITVANPATVSVSELPGVYWPTTSWFVDADTCHRFPYPAGVTVFINGTPHFGNELRVLTATDTQFTGFTGLRVQTTGAEALVLTGFETGPVLYQLESPIIVGSDIVIRANTLGGVIECSPSLTGPWTIVPTESGEVRVSTTNAPAKFFRVRGN